MATRLFQASIALLLLVVTASEVAAPARPDYLAPIPASGGTACGDTAPDCMDVCTAYNSSARACQLQSRIGDYLRCVDIPPTQ